MPDADEFGDRGANTLKHIVESQLPHLPHLKKLGLFNIDGLGLPKESDPLGSFARCIEQSKGKDTTTGHYEMAGLTIKTPYKTFGNAFPEEIIQQLEASIGTKTIGNYPASGTEIIQTLGTRHVETGYPIVYLSADSLMQIAMHEEVIPLEKQYEICAAAREIMMGDNAVARVICRPFMGSAETKFTRTENRRDFALDPPSETMLDRLSDNDFDVIAIGKIEDIFNRKGITEVDHSKNNKDGIDSIVKYLQQNFNGLLFANLVDFDMLYGHRRDVAGYAAALEYFDSRLNEILSHVVGEDVLIITADHGCDPTFKGTDHTREYIPVVVYGGSIEGGKNLGTRTSFNDISATVLDYFNLPNISGKSFLTEVKK